MMRCRECGYYAEGEDERDFEVMEAGNVVCYECPKCASPRVGSIDPDGDA